MRAHQVYGLVVVLGLLLTGCSTDTPSSDPAGDSSAAASDGAKKADSTSVDTNQQPEPTSTVDFDIDARRAPKLLSEYGLYADIRNKVFSPDVIPYQLNSHSYLDGATQKSWLWIPSGSSVTYRGDDALDFPVGTVLIQNLFFAEGDQAKERLVETRLMIHRTRGWYAIPYLWNEDSSDARRSVIGAATEISHPSTDTGTQQLTYLTPNMNECKRCHVYDKDVTPIGVTAANLNRTVTRDGQDVNQLVAWQERGLLTDLPEDLSTVPQLPEWHDTEGDTVEHRARAWLDVNCSHCHNPHGPASVSGLDLTYGQQQPVRYGVYKPPVAAGRGSKGLKYSVLPQKPDESFLVHRMASTELGVMMPPLGRSSASDSGVALIRDWIAGMEVDEALAEAARNPMKAYKDAINGGDAARGEEIFHKVQKCSTCHKVGDKGGSIGPNLTDVATRTKRDYLLESIVMPSAKIAKGYETVILVMLDGRTITGTVQSEDEYEIVIGNAQETRKVKKEDIDERVPSDVSTMPTLANLLTVDDVRNLIAYLMTLDTPVDK